jgi:hypothetical protein
MASQPDYAPQDEPADSGAMSEAELASHLEQHEQRAIGYFESEIAADQANALDRYYRRPYGDEQAGRSKVVDATVAITVDNALAAILKPFVSAEETVSFEPKSEEDEEAAKQATDYVNYVLHNDNCGFQIFHDWFKDALLQKVGVVKAYWEDYERERVIRVENLDPIQAQELQESGEAIAIYGPNDMGLYSADISHVEKDGKLCVDNVPPEEYRISPYARPGKVPPYEAHITQKARSELIEMGFDPEVVQALPKSGTAISDQRMQSRYQDEEFGSGRLDQPGDSSRELVDFKHEFSLIDFDGDGVSELREVMRSGNVILYNEEVDEGPFARICPVPMPHKIYGQSLADQVIDEQRIATVLWRQTLDNLYLSNNPRPVVGEGAERSDGSTLDSIMDDSPGALILAKDASQLGDFSVNFVADKSFPMLEYVAAQAEARSGISKHGQGMDPDAIDKAGQVTATQSAIMEDGRNARSELVARIFAETGVKRLFKLMLRLLVQHQPKARMIRLRNKWVEMDPRSWNADMDLTISVGLGIGNKAQQIAVADGVLQTMAELGQTPFASLIDKEKVYNALKRKFTAAGIKNIDEFLVEPERDEQGNIVPEPPQPDPETMKAQAELQLQQQKLQGEQQMAQAKLQMQQQEAALKLQLAREEAEAQAQLAREKALFEAELAREQMQLERELAQQRAQIDMEIAARNEERRDRESESKVSKNREGGDLSK